MAENMSLADQVIQALAEVRGMDAGMEMEHPERHAVRNLKRVAEQLIAGAMRTAIDLAWQAKDIREMTRAIETDKTPNVEVTGAARLYRAASSDRRERGRPPGWASGGEACV